jgi:hypothetical protein
LRPFKILPFIWFEICIHKKFWPFLHSNIQHSTDHCSLYKLLTSDTLHGLNCYTVRDYFIWIMNVCNFVTEFSKIQTPWRFFNCNLPLLHHIIFQYLYNKCLKLNTCSNWFKRLWHWLIRYINIIFDIHYVKYIWPAQCFRTWLYSCLLTTGFQYTEI